MYIISLWNAISSRERGYVNDKRVYLCVCVRARVCECAHNALKGNVLLKAAQMTAEAEKTVSAVSLPVRLLHQSVLF